MKRLAAAVLLLFSAKSFSQVTYSSEAKGILKATAGLNSSKILRYRKNLSSINSFRTGIDYAFRINDRFSIHISPNISGKGGKDKDTTTVKYRTYNAGLAIGPGFALSPDFRILVGIEPEFFLDTRKVVLEGSLKGGLLHIPIHHFKKYDFPLFAGINLKLSPKAEIELRYSLSSDYFLDKSKVSFRSVFILIHYHLWKNHKARENKT